MNKKLKKEINKVIKDIEILEDYMIDREPDKDSVSKEMVSKVTNSIRNDLRSILEKEDTVKRKTFTLTIDNRFDSVLDELKENLHKSSQAEVVRLSVALLKTATDATLEGNKLTISDKDGNVIKELVFPI
jgi:hypothetical protein